ncbi:MAG TPA: hypothetical protein PK344_07020 [Syntrophorhabdaceae bacterium]|nr:hypothetical protein [Syntrophorhabdaceae bacterium]
MLFCEAKTYPDRLLTFFLAFKSPRSVWLRGIVRFSLFFVLRNVAVRRTRSTSDHLSDRISSCLAPLFSAKMMIS